ncbi:MAG TPA: hypothetical protein VEZ90_04270 [Blastocatellia bacterium]|nr:hypothetical protein [Blastocatellia bacterium]
MARLSPEQFQHLLESLARGGLEAAEAYVSIHKKLVLYFETQGCASPPDQADKTIDIVARRLAEGSLMENTIGFFWGVARKVRLEDRRTANRTVPIPEGFHPTAPDRSIDDTLTVTQICLDRCLNLLPKPDRDLIMEYYEGDKRTKINARRTLAERLEVSPENLRKKASRIRTLLKKCVVDCLKDEERRRIS